MARSRLPRTVWLVADWKLLVLKRDGACAECGTDLFAGTQAEWSRSTRTVRCTTHGDHKATPPPVPASGTAGGSAEYEYERRRRNWEKSVTDAHPIIGKFLLTIHDEPQNVKAWQTGAVGERAIGDLLDRLALEHGFLVLHDRRIPGSEANIDHVAITPSGVYAIDAKNYTGMVRVHRTGGILTPLQETLYVGRRDCTKLVAGVHMQANLLRQALETAGHDAPVMGMLAFHAAEWPWLGKPQSVEGVFVNGKGITPIITRPGGLDEDTIVAITVTLAKAFPPARRTNT